ncbi:MAG: tetratricopeptide repeat protein [Magnetococcales bacterium]|nr:tetratricopeptide repeat protein [Magnetococcales bacterium]
MTSAPGSAYPAGMETTDKPQLSVELAIHQALELAQAGQLDEAASLCVAVLQAVPDHPEAGGLLGQMADAMFQQAVQHHQAGQLAEAVACYRWVLGVLPGHVDALNNMGLALQGMGQLEEAVGVLQSALKLDPGYPEAHANLGIALAESGRTQEAAEAYRKAIELRPDYPEACNNLGSALWEMGALEEAQACCRQAIHLQPDYAEAYSNLGNVLEASGQLEEAVVSYRKALALRPDFINALNNLGIALKHQGKLEEALACHQQAVSQQPDSAESYVNCGNLQKELGNTDKAVVAYYRAIELKPDYAEAHGNLGIVLAEHNRFQEALSCYRRAIELKPDFASAHCNLGSAYRDQNALPEAVACYRQAVAVKPDYAEAYSLLGDTLAEQGAMSEAMQHSLRAVTLDPKNPTCWSRFAGCVGRMQFVQCDTAMFRALLLMLDQPTVCPHTISHSVTSALRHHPVFKEAVILFESGPLDLQLDVISRLFSQTELLLRQIVLSPITELDLEHMLTCVRRATLQRALESDEALAGLPFLVALAVQCFINEYLFSQQEEECNELAQLHARIGARFDEGKKVPSGWIAVVAAYRPLHGCDWADRLLEEREVFHDIDAIIRCQIIEVHEELEIRSQIKPLAPIQNRVSQEVRAQYEANPYPRWVRMPISHRPKSLQSELIRFPHQPIDGLELGGLLELLVAGCGTGRHAIGSACHYHHCHVTAVDLSLSSLSYAIRKSRAMGLTHIDYRHGDILDLGRLERRFHLIESAGVLHHMEDPMAGWRVLVDLLRPGGVMKIGLYSELARQSVVQCRAMIAQKGYDDTPQGVRRFREYLKAYSQEHDGTMMAEMTQWRDFFSLSECRDLLFHVQEHRFTLLQIERALEELGLTFLGFQGVGSGTMKAFAALYPEDPEAQRSLALWHRFEVQNPETFIGMYQLWLQKPLTTWEKG